MAVVYRVYYCVYSACAKSDNMLGSLRREKIYISPLISGPLIFVPDFICLVVF